MKLINLLEQGTIKGFEVIQNTIILSVFIEKDLYALDVDTSNIQSGTQLVRIEEYSIENGILNAGGASLSVETEVLGFE